MRPIKFRAWDKERLCFLKPIETTQLVIRPISGKITDGAVDVSEKIELLQYTGLKDKDGIEIYEGDIVENGNGKVGYIVFLIQEAGFVVVLKDRDYRLGHRNTGEGYNISGDHKVIGNVYTNPELMEESAE